MDRYFEVRRLLEYFETSNVSVVLKVCNRSKDLRGTNNAESFGRSREIERVWKDTSTRNGSSDSLNPERLDGTDRFRRVRNV